jgi:hypothetical protein
LSARSFSSEQHYQAIVSHSLSNLLYASRLRVLRGHRAHAVSDENRDSRSLIA